MKKILSIIMLSLFMMTGLAWAKAYLLNDGFENFEGTGSDSRPLGWHNPDNIEKQTNNSYIRTGTGALRLLYEDDGTASIISPLLNDPGLLSFWYISGHNTTAWELKLYYASDYNAADGDWAPLDTITNPGQHSSYVEYTRDLSILSNIYIKLIYKVLGDTKPHLNVDDFTVTSRSVDTIAFWDFNDPPASENWANPLYSTTGDGKLTYDFTTTSSTDGIHLNGLDGINTNPGGSFVVTGEEGEEKYLKLEFSTLGYTNVTISYAFKKEGNGFNEHSIRYSDDESSWTYNPSWRNEKIGWIKEGDNNHTFTVPAGDEFAIYDLDLPTGSGSVAYNCPNLHFRIKHRGAEDANGSNIYDNIRITGKKMATYIPNVSEDVDGITVTMRQGMANDSTADMPDIPNTSMGNNYKRVNLALIGDGSWTIELNSSYPWYSYHWQGEWREAALNDDGTFTITVNANEGDSRDLFIVMSSDNPTLPVELSSFMVTQESGGSPIITWETQTETGVNGFYIYRGVNKNIGEATLISSLIEATNSSLAHSYSYEDTDLIEDGTYYYWLNVSDLNGHQSYYGPAELNFIYMEEEAAPEVTYKTALRNIYPNPFNPSTNIGFELAEDSEVKIDVYNARGQLVRSFAPFTHGMGYGSIVWDGKDEGGSSASSGIYLFRMTVGNKSFSTKAIMLK